MVKMRKNEEQGERLVRLEEVARQKRERVLEQEEATAFKIQKSIEKFGA
jgi:hypothetical protein